jgi:hypothetical protein
MSVQQDLICELPEASRDELFFVASTDLSGVCLDGAYGWRLCEANSPFKYLGQREIVVPH